MLTVEESGLLSSDLSKKVNLFVGAGFSTLAKNKFSRTLPVGDGLKRLLLDDFDLSQYEMLDLPSIYALLLTDRRDALRKYLEETFTISAYDSRYDSLRKLDVDFLYTTNIDDLPFHIFNARSGEPNRALHDLAVYGPPRHAGEFIQYIPLHGCVRHEDADFLFTYGQTSSAFASNRETWYVFQRELQSRPTIFLGYGMRDAGVLQALHEGPTQSNFNRWILLRESESAAIPLYKSLGFHVLVGDIDAFLKYVEDNVEAAQQIVDSGIYVEFIGQVPTTAKIAQRSIKSFFRGAEPEWSDAYSSQVVRRQINSSIKNSIYLGRHVVIVGLPLSGKSTILKQVAAEVSSDRLALYFDQINEPLADRIVSEHAGSDRRPLIFVDSLIDSRSSIDRLVKDIGARMVCTEQSLYFDAVNLRAMQGNLEVHSTSEVSTQDLQRIIGSIPAEIRRWNPDSLSLVEADFGELGLFESFRRHVFDETLTSRFRSKLAEFEAKDPEAFQVYIMACYVAACRAYVSFDMIFMFLDKKNKQYGDVYDVTDRIKSFLVEVDLDNDPHQDYFSVRSGALARIALHESQAKSFGRVFDRFHKAVSSRLIVSYPVFRRYAYDVDFALRAYPRVEDGLSFYKWLVKATDNAYDYQHGAIYLSKKKNFTSAFEWIDTALSKSGGRIFSIRNTHARIIFEANIDILRLDSSNSTAFDGIRESMDVLQGCIEKDARRTYHLFRYCDQALQCAAIVSDALVKKWLVHAKDSLEKMEEQASVSNSRESYNWRKYRNLLNEVKLALADRRVGDVS